MVNEVATAVQTIDGTTVTAITGGGEHPEAVVNGATLEVSVPIFFFEFFYIFLKLAALVPYAGLLGISFLGQHQSVPKY